jgi:hypothetical protein
VYLPTTEGRSTALIDQGKGPFSGVNTDWLEDYSAFIAPDLWFRHLTPARARATLPPMSTTDDDEDDVSAVDRNVEELHRLDKEINDHEYDANRLRWEYGRHLIDGRGDRQRLPRGILNDLSAATGTSRRELQYRMKFADLFGTEAICATCCTYPGTRLSATT